MSQCGALLYRQGSNVGHYCVLDAGHKGDHRTDDGRRFTEAQVFRFPQETKPRKKARHE